MLQLRLQGCTLQQIADVQEPKISFQAVSKAIKTALRDVVIEPLEQVRSLELLRLDELLAAVYEKALSGDIAAIDRCLAIMYRRARLMGLDQQTGGWLRFGPNGPYEEVDPKTIRVEIVGDPERERTKWLESERERLLALTSETPDPSRMN